LPPCKSKGKEVKMATVINMGTNSGSTITINGTTFSGKNITIDDNSVIVDGVVTQDISNEKDILIMIDGNVESVKTISGYIKAENVGKVKTTSGDIKCKNVSGNVSTVSGDISCLSVGKTTKTVSGDIYYK